MAALGEQADAIFSVAVTWLTLLLPVCGLGLALLGMAHDRPRGWAIAGTIVNGLGLIAAAFTLYILTG